MRAGIAAAGHKQDVAGASKTKGLRLLGEGDHDKPPITCGFVISHPLGDVGALRVADEDDGAGIERRDRHLSTAKRVYRSHGSLDAVVEPSHVVGPLLPQRPRVAGGVAPHGDQGSEAARGVHPASKRQHIAADAMKVDESDGALWRSQYDFELPVPRNF
jgi:hypothetical protein